MQSPSSGNASDSETDVDELDAQEMEMIDVRRYLVFDEPTKAGCDMKIMDADTVWHNLTTNADRTEGTEQGWGTVWRIDKDWYEWAARPGNVGQACKELGGARKSDSMHDGNVFVFEPSPSLMLLHSELLAKNQLCVLYAFANAVLLLLDEKSGTSNLMRLPRDVFDLMIDRTELCYEEFYHDETSKAHHKSHCPRAGKRLASTISPTSFDTNGASR